MGRVASALMEMATRIAMRQRWTPDRLSDAPAGVSAHRDFREYPSKGGHGLVDHAEMSDYLSPNARWDFDDLYLQVWANHASHVASA